MLVLLSSQNKQNTLKVIQNNDFLFNTNLKLVYLMLLMFITNIVYVYLHIEVNL